MQPLITRKYNLVRAFMKDCTRNKKQEGHEALYRSPECKKVLEKDGVYEFGCSNYVSAVNRVRTAIMQASDLLFNYS